LRVDVGSLAFDGATQVEDIVEQGGT
jgi:hypothetical protein